ncbi:MAG: extracellular catalytic domain type 2 short-chain-length polyhydroxyalkanoate depolymerase [Burkholderiaceae bacterium]
MDPSDVSVSGISSGGYMAQQFLVAYSSSLRGAGIVAGGPYYCAKGSVVTALTDCTTPTVLNPPDVNQSIQATENYASRGAIDATSHLRNAKVWLFSGSKDETVYPIVMDKLDEYTRHYVTASNIFYEKTIPAAHSMVTDDYGFACDHKGDANNASDNFINNCNYDAAGKILAHIYGPLKSQAARLRGTFVNFSQSEFIADPVSHSMNVNGYAYVPAACDEGAKCRVHVAFHGCLQYPERIGDAYRVHTGYNEWADTNRIVVLYPQTTASSTPTAYNPKGCWDWWGYDDANYATRDGRQMHAIKAMIDRLSAGWRPGPIGAPAQLHATGSATDSVSLAWAASAGPRLAGYNIYYARSAGGPYKLAANTSETSATVGSLATGTPYYFLVRAIDRRNAESSDSNRTSAATSMSPEPVPIGPVTLATP